MPSSGRALKWQPRQFAIVFPLYSPFTGAFAMEAPMTAEFIAGNWKMPIPVIFAATIQRHIPWIWLVGRLCMKQQSWLRIIKATRAFWGLLGGPTTVSSSTLGSIRWKPLDGSDLISVKNMPCSTSLDSLLSVFRLLFVGRWSSSISHKATSGGVRSRLRSNARVLWEKCGLYSLVLFRKLRILSIVRYEYRIDLLLGLNSCSRRVRCSEEVARYIE